MTPPNLRFRETVKRFTLLKHGRRNNDDGHIKNICGHHKRLHHEAKPFFYVRSFLDCTTTVCSIEINQEDIYSSEMSTV